MLSVAFGESNPIEFFAMLIYTWFSNISATIFGTFLTDILANINLAGT
jgi:hypothetical protein